MWKLNILTSSLKTFRSGHVNPIKFVSHPYISNQTCMSRCGNQSEQWQFTGVCGFLLLEFVFNLLNSGCLLRERKVFGR